MATRLTYRNKLKDRILGLEDEGYGDFEFTDAELDTYLDLAVSGLFPDLFKRVSQTALTVTAYGTNHYGSVTVAAPERVYLVEDATELTSITGWRTRPSTLIGFDTDCVTSVNVYYYDAYTLPGDDATDAGISDVWTPVIVLGALIDALASRHDGGARPDPSTGHQEVTLVDRLQRMYDTAREKRAMSLPSVVC